MKYLFLLVPFLVPVIALAQPSAHIYVTIAPSGACPTRAIPQILISTGAIYTCGNGTWTTGSGGGTGTVTSVGLSRTNDTNVTATITGSPVTTSGTINVALGWTSVLSVARGGLGVGTITGPMKGNGTSAVTAALAADIVGLFSTCSGIQSLGADGACHTAGSGTVTVVGAGNLTSTAFMTGGGTQTSQTPSATSTLDASGNASFAGNVSGASFSTTGGAALTGTGILGLSESTGQACAANTDCLIADSVAHVMKLSNNNGTATPLLLSSATGIQTWLTTPSSANLAAALTDETGTGAAVFANTPTLVTPILGTPTSGDASNLTNIPVNQAKSGAVLPVANGGTGITALGTGVATALGTNVSGSGAICLASGSSCASSAGGGITVYSGSGLTVTAGTRYFPIGGGASPSTTETDVDIEAPSAATITNFYVTLSVAIGAGNTGVFTWRKAGVDQSSTCTISGTGAGGTTCSDLTHSFTVAQGDLIDIKLVTTGTIVVMPNIIMSVQFGTTGSNGTVNTGTTGQVGYYAAGGTAISGVGPGATDKPLVGVTSSAPVFSNVTLTNPATTATLTIANNKTLTVNNSITLTGTDATTMTLPTTSQTIPGLGQANTWTTGAQDFGGVTSLKLPTSGGASPSASGQCAVDSTRGELKCYDDLAAASTPKVGVLSAQVAASDTLSCATINTTPTLFATTYTVPANFLIANKVLRIDAGFTTIGSAGAPTFVLKLKLGSTYIFAATSSNPAQATRPTGSIFTIQGTAAPGASVNVDTAQVGAGIGAPFNTVDSLTQPVAVATNTSNILAFELTCGANTAGNSLQLRQFIVEALN